MCTDTYQLSCFVNGSICVGRADFDLFVLFENIASLLNARRHAGSSQLLSACLRCRALIGARLILSINSCSKTLRGTHLLILVPPLHEYDERRLLGDHLGRLRQLRHSLEAKGARPGTAPARKHSEKKSRTIRIPIATSSSQLTNTNSVRLPTVSTGAQHGVGRKMVPTQYIANLPLPQLT